MSKRKLKIKNQDIELCVNFSGWHAFNCLSDVLVKFVTYRFVGNCPC